MDIPVMSLGLHSAEYACSVQLHDITGICMFCPITYIQAAVPPIEHARTSAIPYVHTCVAEPHQKSGLIAGCEPGTPSSTSSATARWGCGIRSGSTTQSAT